MADEPPYLKLVPDNSDAADVARRLILAAGYEHVERRHQQAIAAWIIRNQVVNGEG